MNTPPERLMTVMEVMSRLNCSRTTLWRLVRDRELAAVHVREQLRFERRDVEAYIVLDRLVDDLGNLSGVLGDS
ncbi:MAG: helix-turn-helix domain-containing protein, partial [Planctomycetia bacterium]|nr:helix-turn-helix domain-containing protein [Planctomycetia bacterium]